MLTRAAAPLQRAPCRAGAACNPAKPAAPRAAPINYHGCRRLLPLHPHGEAAAASVAARAAALEATPAAAERLQAEGGRVDWGKQWWAVALAPDVDASRPYAVELLGRPLVIWRDGGGAWRCFEDRCPHRNVPLSEGKVWGDGTLLCAYHGWRFDGGGRCVAIPQAASPEAEAAACASGRACVQTHPIKEAQGVLFVWGEGGPAAAAESERQPLPIDDLRAAAEAVGEPAAVFIKPYLRDVPTDYLTVVEQALDPAHVDWAHHMVQGDRRTTDYGQWETWASRSDPGSGSQAHAAANSTGSSDGGDVSSSTAAASSADGAAAGAAGSSIAAMQWQDAKSTYTSLLELITPAVLRYSQQQTSVRGSVSAVYGTVVSVANYNTPIRPGWTRIAVIGVAAGPSAPLPMRILSALPRWAQHALLMNPTTDGDLVLLHAAEQRARTAARAGGEAADSSAWRRSYYLPTGADRMVSAFRRFVEGRGGHGPWGAPLAALPDYTPLITDRRQLLDRSALHTAHCAACKQASERMALLARVAAAAAVAAWSAAVFWAAAAFHAGGGVAAALPAALTSRAALVAAAAGGALALLWRALLALRTKWFDYSEYVHSEHLN